MKTKNYLKLINLGTFEDLERNIKNSLDNYIFLYKARPNKQVLRKIKRFNKYLIKIWNIQNEIKGV